MKIVGILTEFNPFHCGHRFFLQELRHKLGENTGIVCIMSGNFVQRGEPALLPKWDRAEAALRCGADLVLELPVGRSLSSAERFAEGAVYLMQQTGCITHLAFGSECGDPAALQRAADCLLSDAYREELRKELKSGASFASCRQRAAEQLLSPEDGALLSRANNNLGIEYLKAARRLHFDCEAVTVTRRGADHDSESREEGYLSGSAIRQCILADDWEAVEGAMPEAALKCCRSAFETGRAPVTMESLEQLLLARLRTMEEQEWEALPDCGEGLHHRFYQAARSARSVEELLAQVKTKRYAHARLRRTLMCALLGIDSAAAAELPQYLRVLGCAPRGREILAMMRKTAGLPVLTKAAHAKKLQPEARRQFEREARATELYGLCCPAWREVSPGNEWRTNPKIL